MAYPTSLNTYSAVAGTSLVATEDHAVMHNMVGSAVVQVETTIGTTSGTAILKDATAGKFAVMNSGGTLNDGVLGTPMSRGGTIGTATIGTCTITGGTASDITLGTPIIDQFTTSATTLPSVANRALAPTVGTLTDAVGTLAINAPSAQIFELTLGTAGGDRTFAAPTNPTDGQSLVIRAKQNAAVTGTAVWNAIYRWQSGTAGTASFPTTASSWGYYAFRYNSTDTKWDDQGSSTDIV